MGPTKATILMTLVAMETLSKSIMLIKIPMSLTMSQSKKITTMEMKLFTNTMAITTLTKVEMSTISILLAIPLQLNTTVMDMTTDIASIMDVRTTSQSQSTMHQNQSTVHQNQSTLRQNQSTMIVTPMITTDTLQKPIITFQTTAMFHTVTSGGKFQTTTCGTRPGAKTTTRRELRLRLK